MNSCPFYNVKDFGAIGDGIALDNNAIQAAIMKASGQGGGTVYFPAGRYLTGSIFLQSNITFALEAGSTLLGSQNLADYRVIDGWWEGRRQKTYASLVSGENLKNVAVVGRGTIDGQGGGWWALHREKKLDYARPKLIGLTACTNVLVEGIQLINSPSWTINPVRCENVTVDKVTIINPADSPNTDGINPDSCRYVHISNCFISVGDDCITLKSGSEEINAIDRAPCENITITNCTMAHGHGGVVIGSEMSGGVRRVVISNCVFTGTDRGIRIKSRRGRGGVVEDIRVSNIIMEDVLCPVTMNLYYACGAWGNKENSDKLPHPVNAGTPQFKNIHLSGITARGAKYAAGFLLGLPEMPLEAISLHDIDISMAQLGEAGYPEMADELEKVQQAGLMIGFVRGLSLEHVRINGQVGAAIKVWAAQDVEVQNCSTNRLGLDSPFIHLSDVNRASIQKCQIPIETPIMLKVDGKDAKDIHYYPTNRVQGSERVMRMEGSSQVVIEH